jgi:DNA invertase Pin-like site-specific DNA recombinase
MPATPAIFRVHTRLTTNSASAANTRSFAGLVFLEEHVYVDEAVSGVGADRPGLGRLLNAALSAARPFDVILLDDSGRLARNTKDALTFFERLNFAGIRLIAVSQGIDSDNEQAHVLPERPAMDRIFESIEEHREQGEE